MTEILETVSTPVEDVIFDFLLNSIDGFDISHLRALFSGISDQQFGLAFHAARERARSESQLELITQSQTRPGFYFRANGEQRSRRGANFIETANRKLLRAMRVIDCIPAEELDSSQKSKASRVRERAAFQLGRRKAAMQQEF